MIYILLGKYMYTGQRHQRNCVFKQKTALKMMNSRIEYMNQNGYISNEDYIALSEKCEKLIYKTLLARNLWIKYSMTIGNTNSSELLKKIYNYVLESKNMDKEFTKYLMSCIRSPKSGN